MRQVLLRAAALLRRPHVLLVLLLLPGGGGALTALPIFSAPGFELGLAMALGFGLFGGVIGIASARLERRLLGASDDGAEAETRPLRLEVRPRPALRALAAALLLSSVCLLGPLLAAIFRSLTVTGCDPFLQLSLCLVLAVPSAVLSCSAGLFCGLVAQSRKGALSLYVLLLVASLAWTAWPLYEGPQAFAFNHFLGHWPGPLYDEALRLSPALLWFRTETMLWSVLLASLAAALLNSRTGRLSFRASVRWKPLTLGLLAVLGIQTIERHAVRLRLRMSSTELAALLGGRRESAHFALYFPRTKSAADADRFLKDLEFRRHQLETFFGKLSEPSSGDDKLRIYLYPNSGLKQEWVGAGGTQFAKPWRKELHLNDAPFPHPALRHELAHLLAAPWGTGPFRIPSRAGLWPLMGLTEGIAVAADDPEEPPLHAGAASMRKQGVLPDLRQLLGPFGFYASAPARAYAAAGSFIRYLFDHGGAEKVRALYAHGRFEEIYGKTLEALIRDWETFLATQPELPGAEQQAAVRFRQPSLFVRRCAREVAALKERARSALEGDPEEALDLFRRCDALQPGDPAFGLGEAQAQIRLGQKEAALQTLAALIERLRSQPALADEARLARAQLARELGQERLSTQLLETVAQSAAQPSQQRTAQLKLMARGGAAGAAVDAYFAPGPEDLKLLRLHEALESEPSHAALNYLLGRRLVQRGAYADALLYLRRLNGQALPVKEAGPALPDELWQEGLRLELEAAYGAGDCAGVRQTAAHLPSLGPSLKRRAAEWVERCDFEKLPKLD